MKSFGLIGYPLSHSFSKKYFTEKFAKEGVEYNYALFPIVDINLFPQLIKDNATLAGLNVTIPYKEAVLPYLTELDDTAKAVGAVNTIKISPEGILKGYNTDVVGFAQSLKPLLHPHHERALILGTGGAAKAVAYVLKNLGIKHYFVSREPKNLPNCLSYADLNEAVFNACKLVVNTTPVGMSPNSDAAPALPYQYFTSQHLAYDLIYNPTETAFMQKAAAQGAHTVNGLNMLYMQAEAAWKIWQG